MITAQVETFQPVIDEIHAAVAMAVRGLTRHDRLQSGPLLLQTRCRMPHMPLPMP
jgi:hypothetical protein